MSPLKMPRQRKPENRKLPMRWVYQHGAYYYRVPPGLELMWDGRQMFRLGTTLAGAYKVWAERINSPIEARNIGQLLDRYGLEVVPAKAVKTQTENIRAIGRLRPVFGHMPLTGFRPRYVYQYVDKRGAKTAAHREIEVLSHAFTKAVEWGYIDRHPFKTEVRLKSEPPRTRYIEDWEVIEALSLAPRRKRGSVLAVQAYIRIKLLTGLRRGDLLRLRLVENLREDGIHISTHKTGKRIITNWSDELRAAVEMAKAARPVDISPWLFCNRAGTGYMDESTGDPPGWKSIWQRFMARALTETAITERFTEHDLRAKVGSDAESLERARELLAHADTRTTQRAYRRKPERIQPAR